MKNTSILGAIAGDILGSAYEFYPVKDYNFNLFNEESAFTDDTVLTMAVADWILHDPELSSNTLVDYLQSYGKTYRGRGYGDYFYQWIYSKNPAPYNSYGNGSAMRVSPVGFAFDTLAETLDIAQRSAEVTHNHPEGIKGAQTTAAAIFWARQGESKEDIRKNISQFFGYDMQRTCEEIRKDYNFSATCQGSVPESIIAFLESTDYESAIRLAISFGGDSDTMACITGGIASAYYKEIPQSIADFTTSLLPEEFLKLIQEYNNKFVNK